MLYVNKKLKNLHLANTEVQSSHSWESLSENNGNYNIILKFLFDESQCNK